MDLPDSICIYFYQFLNSKESIFLSHTSKHFQKLFKDHRTRNGFFRYPPGNVLMCDIGGLEQQKKDLIELVRSRSIHRHIYEKW